MLKNIGIIVVKHRHFTLLCVSAILFSVSAVGYAHQRDHLSTDDATQRPFSEYQALIFENTYGNIPARREPKTANWQTIRTQLKEKAGMNLKQNMHVGVDSVKVKSSAQKSEIIALDSHVAPRNGATGRAKGYGVTFKIKFD